jgi:protease-4
MADPEPPVYGNFNPPPLSAQPAPLTAPPPPPRRRGRGWMVLSLVLMLVLFLVLAGDCLRFFHGLMGGSRAARSEQSLLMESIVEDNGAKEKFAIIDIQGIITGDLLDRGLDMVELVKDQLKAAAEDKEVRAVLLKVDSPGGEVMASDAISEAISRFQKTSRKPVIASFGSVAASGGYYVSAPCRWIVAHELTMTGSIGVIMHGYNYRGLLDKVGVRPVVFKSGPFKDMLRGDKSEEEILPEERRMTQALIDQTYNRFKEVVATGRHDYRDKSKNFGKPLVSDWVQYADGRILSGKEAFQYGFVDELGDFETAVERAKILTGTREANLIRYEMPFDLGSILRLFVKSEAPVIKVDVGMEAPKLKAGHLYFLNPAL